MHELSLLTDLLRKINAVARLKKAGKGVSLHAGKDCPSVFFSQDGDQSAFTGDVERIESQHLIRSLHLLNVFHQSALRDFILLKLV